MKSTYSRRDILKFGGLGAASLTVPGWLTRALAEPGAKSATRSLVLVMLGGGNDGLNTVVPVGDPLYAKARPTEESGLRPESTALRSQSETISSGLFSRRSARTSAQCASDISGRLSTRPMWASALRDARLTA